LALWIRRTYGIPYVITEHFTGFERGLVQGKERDLALEVFQNAQSRAAVSDVFGRKMKKAFDCDFISIPNIVPLKEFVKTPLKKNGPEIFLFVGDLLPKKNPMNLLQAFVEFCKEQPDSELRFIGDGPEQKKLKDFVQKKGLKQVSFLGRLDRQSVAKELQKASCLVSPSLHETFGVVVIEAMAVGRPSLVTQSGGPEELVARHDCGVIAEGFDDTSLLKGLRMISQRAWDSGRLSQKAQGYSPEKIGQLILKFYSSGLKHG
jgi:glycosyltransferase involved in cell wall biosynthesis